MDVTADDEPMSGADVLGRPDLGGHLIGGIGAPPAALGQLHRAPRIQNTHSQQPLRDRGGLITGVGAPI
jgi:hypothetical protein